MCIYWLKNKNNNQKKSKKHIFWVLGILFDKEIDVIQ